MNQFSRALVRWHMWLYRTDNLNLFSDEKIVTDSYGWLIGSYFGTRDRIVLTNKRLLFRSDSARLFGPDQVGLNLALTPRMEVTVGSRWQFKAAVPGVSTFSLSTEDWDYQFQTPDAALLTRRIIERGANGP